MNDPVSQLREHKNMLAKYVSGITNLNNTSILYMLHKQRIDDLRDRISCLEVIAYVQRYLPTSCTVYPRQTGFDVSLPGKSESGTLPTKFSFSLPSDVHGNYPRDADPFNPHTCRVELIASSNRLIRFENLDNLICFFEWFVSLESRDFPPVPNHSDRPREWDDNSQYLKQEQRLYLKLVESSSIWGNLTITRMRGFSLIAHPLGAGLLVYTIRRSKDKVTDEYRVVIRRKLIILGFKKFSELVEFIGSWNREILDKEKKRSTYRQRRKAQRIALARSRDSTI